MYSVDEFDTSLYFIAMICVEMHLITVYLRSTVMILTNVYSMQTKNELAEMCSQGTQKYFDMPEDFIIVCSCCTSVKSCKAQNEIINSLLSVRTCMEQI